MDSIIKHGKVIRGWLGVSIQNLTPELAKSLGIKETEGALVSGVESGSPADKAGLKRGDLITEMNGKKITDVTNLRNTVAALLRERRSISRSSGTARSSPGHGRARRVPRKRRSSRRRSTTMCSKASRSRSLRRALRDKLDLPEDLNGVVVTDVSSNSPAQGGLQPNDVIQEIDRKPVQSAKEYDEIVRKIGKKDTVLLLINRGGGSAYLTLEP